MSTNPDIPTPPIVEFDETDQLAIDTIRTLTMDAVQAANSGHPGMPMAMAPAIYLLYTRFLRHNPQDPRWPDRDRFILSAGHGSMLLYAMLHLSGYDLSLDDIKNFRQWGSRTPGHPEYEREGGTPGIETTTGPLGQGFANGVGMALAERFLRDRYGSDVVDHRTFAICSDGDLMEGIASEAASLAGHLGLGQLVYLYDDNEITIDGGTELSFGEDVKQRFEAYGWHVAEVADVNDLTALAAAIQAGCEETEHPSLVRIRSVIGYPSPGKQGTSGSHGAALGEEEVRATKTQLGWDPDRHFEVSSEVYQRCDGTERGKQLQEAWRERFQRWHSDNEQLAQEWDAAQSGKPQGPVQQALAEVAYPAGEKKVATRVASGAALNALKAAIPTMVGGSADLAGSVNTLLKDESDYTPARPGRNIHWGVREHAMAAAVNGMALHGGIVKPYGATFLIFSDYMRPAIRLSALMDIPSVWVFSHDSLGVGEDGPTHQPVEQLASLRAIPNLTVIRPGDANETLAAWEVVTELPGPACVVLTRQGVTVFDRQKFAPASGLAKGAYTLSQSESAQAIIVATGSEVELAVAAQEVLAGEGIAVNVVSMPSWELFDAQSADYRDSVLIPGLPKLSVEAGVSQGWQRYVDRSISVDRFGASAPGGEVLERYGFTATAVADAVKELLSSIH